MKTKINKEAFDFLYGSSTVIDDQFMFMPFLIEIVDKEEGIVVFHSLDRLPDNLKAMLKEEREGPKEELHFEVEEIDAFVEHGYKESLEIVMEKVIYHLRYIQDKHLKDISKMSGHVLLEEMAKNHKTLQPDVVSKIKMLIDYPEMDYTINVK